MSGQMGREESVLDRSYTFDPTFLSELHSLCSRAGTMIVQARRVENGF